MALVTDRFIEWAGFRGHPGHQAFPTAPNVDPLEPVSDGQPKITIRDQIQAHATDANCRSCHAKLDPLGLAFEHFDAIGRWREVESVRGGSGDLPKVDASGTLADGRSFQNHQAFKKLLVEDPRTLALAFMEQLATYALRRMITVDDMESIEAMVDAHGDHAHPLRDLIRNSSSRICSLGDEEGNSLSR